MKSAKEHAIQHALFFDWQKPFFIDEITSLSYDADFYVLIKIDVPTFTGNVHAPYMYTPITHYPLLLALP